MTAKENIDHHPPFRGASRATRLAALGALVLGVPAAHATTSPVEALKEMSIESLMNVEVVSASRRAESTQSTPSASFVLTRDDLLRTGVTSIPDALRLVPGVQVGHVDANKWAVSMRGFNSREANKLLVLVDGRSIYDRLFSGTLWEAQDFLIEDIDRIEVIRGPGGTLWGANAFNGVINIVTRRASDTQGVLLSANAGAEERSGSARFGGQVGDSQFARIYVKGLERETGYATTGDPYDAAKSRRAGFRWDGDLGLADAFTMSGEVSRADTGIRETHDLVQDIRHEGRNVLLRWRHTGASGNVLQLQAFYDYVLFDSMGYTQSRDTWDLELQHHWQVAERHALVWGAGVRRMQDHTRTAYPGQIDILPLHRTDRVQNAFAQDTIALLPERLSLVLGLKYEETDYAPGEWLPNVRVAWTPDANHTLWGAVSEATRVPSRIESDLTFFNAIRLGGNFGSEKVRAYELGWRERVGEPFWYDLVLFYNDFDDLRTSEAGGPLGNGMYGRGRGAELAVRWQPTPRLRFDGAYTRLASNLAIAPGSTANRGQAYLMEGLAPRHQGSLRSALDVSSRVTLDATLRRVGDLPALRIPAYTDLDVAVNVELTRSLALTLAGRNLLHPHHPEQGFANSATGLTTEIERTAYARLVWEPN